MTIPTLISGLFGRRAPIEAAAVPDAGPVAADAGPRTGRQQEYGVSVVVAGGAGDGCPVPPGTYATYREMDRDPTLALCRAVVTGPIREADLSYEVREGTPDEWVALVRETVGRLWPAFIADALDSLSLGFKPFEVVWGYRDGRTVIADLKPLAQELTAVLVYPDDPRFGLRARGRTTGTVDLDPRYALVVKTGGQNRDPYGSSWHENSRVYYGHKQRVLRNLVQLGRKASGRQGKLFYPPAADEAENHTNQKIGQSILSQYMGGDGVLIPNAAGALTPDTAADYRNIEGLAAAAVWKLEVEDFGNTGPQVDASLAELAAVNAELSRSWYQPERTSQAAKAGGGTNAESVTQSEVALAVAQLAFGEIVDQLCLGPVDEQLAQNFGEAARGAVKPRAGRLRDKYATGDWALLDALFADPDTLAALIDAGLDVDAVLERRGIPKTKGVLDLVGALAKVRAAKPAPMPATAVAVPPPAPPAN